MTIIAHLSDTHILEDSHEGRPLSERLGLRFLSFGRPLDAVTCHKRLSNGLTRAYARGADHVVLTGDLTEDGTQAQFERLARILDESPFSPDAITLVPGNHDAYSEEHGFLRALRGPLRAWARTSRIGSVVELRDAVVVPVSTVMAQSVVRAAGVVSERQMKHVERVSERERRAVVIAQHHPPLGHAFRAANWVDGLLNRREYRALLGRCERTHVVHGHMHKETNSKLHGEIERFFGAEAVVDGKRPLRVYEARDGLLTPVQELDRVPSPATAWAAQPA